MSRFVRRLLSNATLATYATQWTRRNNARTGTRVSAVASAVSVAMVLRTFLTSAAFIALVAYFLAYVAHVACVALDRNHACRRRSFVLSFKCGFHTTRRTRNVRNAMGATNATDAMYEQTLAFWLHASGVSVAFVASAAFIAFVALELGWKPRYTVRGLTARGPAVCRDRFYRCVLGVGSAAFVAYFSASVACVALRGRSARCRGSFVV